MSKLVIPAIVLIGFAAVIGGYCYALIQEPINVPGSGYFDVPKGQSFNSLARKLSRDSIITIPEPVFKLYGYLTQYQGTIKAGEYELRKDHNAKSLLLMLRQGKVFERKITFPEGWEFSQWRSHLLDNQYLSQTLGRNPDIMKRLNSGLTSLEGQFFPDTYRFTRGASDYSILQRANVRMNQVLKQEWGNRDRTLTLESPQQALILASIVEKETGYEVDRATIASVFNNRLQRRMKLQSDPTVIYGLDKFNGDLKRRHLKTRTPYNTYIIRGLPPTPICNPGLASIRASLNPAFSDYYYFVARGDGSSEFSATLAEHNAAVVRFQKAGRVGNYRSTPQN